MGGEVFSEEPKALKDLAASGDLYRPAPDGSRALLPLWYWLVFIAGVGLLFDVGVRRISLEPGEVRLAAAKTWARMRKKQEARVATEETAFLARLKQKKAVVEENLERKKASRKFESTGPIAEPPPPGADAGIGPAPPVFTPKPSAAPATPAPAEQPGDDYLNKLRQAKKRAPHERDRDE